MGKVRRAAFSPFFSPFPLLFVERSRPEVQSVFEIFSSALEREFFSFFFSFTASSDTAFSKTLVGILDEKKFITAENRNKVAYK